VPRKPLSKAGLRDRYICLAETCRSLRWKGVWEVREFRGSPLPAAERRSRRPSPCRCAAVPPPNRWGRDEGSLRSRLSRGAFQDSSASPRRGWPCRAPHSPRRRTSVWLLRWGGRTNLGAPRKCLYVATLRLWCLPARKAKVSTTVSKTLLGPSACQRSVSIASASSSNGTFVVYLFKHRVRGAGQLLLHLGAARGNSGRSGSGFFRLADVRAGRLPYREFQSKRGSELGKLGTK
jgi:hypothetical protein